MVTEKGETTTSFLLIQQARPSDSGMYQCNPSNAQSKSVMVHVLNGELVSDLFIFCLVLLFFIESVVDKVLLKFKM